MRRRLVALVVLAGLAAGCASGGSGTLQGPRSGHGPLEIASADVVDGALKTITVHNNGTAALPAASWSLVLNGTSGSSATMWNGTVDIPALAPGATASLAAPGGQPDWKDGALLTIRLTRDGAEASLTITPA